MVDPVVLRTLLAVELIAFGVLALVAVTVTALGSRRVRQRSIARRAWLAGLTPLVDGAGAVERRGGDEALVGAALLEGANRAERILEVSRLASQLTGTTARAVVLASGGPEMLDATQRWTRNRRWWRRLRGVRTLTLLRSDQPDLTALLTDRNADVRAEVAAWIATHPTPERVDRLVTLLDDPDAGCRWAAQDALLRCGRLAVAPLAEHLASGPARPAEALEVAAGLADPLLLQATLEGCADERVEVRREAVGSATAIGGERAAEVLRGLLVDPDARVRARAAAGLGLLEHWPAQADLAAALHDTSWEVRRAAAGALDALGPVGRIRLRRATQDPDPRTVEIATHVLDLACVSPEVVAR